MSIQAYQRAATQAESPRELEYRAFGLATAGLIRAKEEGRANLGALASALEANRKLWGMMAADCALEGNQLPPPLRASIVSLSIWVMKHSRAVMRDGADLEPLIDINRTMMEGLQPAA